MTYDPARVCKYCALARRALHQAIGEANQAVTYGRRPTERTFAKMAKHKADIAECQNCGPVA